MVHVLFHRWRRLQASSNAIQPSPEHGGEGQVRVATGVGAAQLSAGELLLSRRGARDADQGRAVDLAPADVDRRFVAGYEPLVGVHCGSHQRRHSPGVRHLPGDEAVGQAGEVVTIGGVIESVVALGIKEALVGMHARAAHAEDGLGHEGRIEIMGSSNSLDRVLHGDGIVGAGQGISETDVNLVLGGGDFVVGHLHSHAHRLQGQGDFLAHDGG